MRNSTNVEHAKQDYRTAAYLLAGWAALMSALVWIGLTGFAVGFSISIFVPLMFLGNGIYWHTKP